MPHASQDGGTNASFPPTACVLRTIPEPDDPSDNSECAKAWTRVRTCDRQIAELVSEYHAEAFAPAPFVPGESPVPVSGKVFDDHELRLLVDASLDFWLTAGRFSESSSERSRSSSASGTRCLQQRLVREPARRQRLDARAAR